MVKNNSSKKKKIIIAVVIAAVVVGSIGYGLAHRYYVKHRTAISSTNEAAAPANKTTVTNDSTSGQAATSPAPVNDKGGDSTTGSQSTNSGAAPDQPHGTFLSNHHPNLGGTPAPSSITSVCLTTPGATCGMTFTKDGQTKSLATQKTNADGATSWNWDVNSAGMTAGSWQVTVTAQLNGKSVSVQDSANLEVRP